MPPPLPAILIHTGAVVAHDAISDRPYAGLVVDAAPLATTDGNVIVSRIAIDRAIHNRQCGAAATRGIVEDTTSSRRSMIPVDTAVEDC